jgi:hypothetical protein
LTLVLIGTIQQILREFEQEGRLARSWCTKDE